MTLYGTITSFTSRILTSRSYKITLDLDVGRNVDTAYTALEQWTATIPGEVTHHWIEGRGHDLKGSDAIIASTVAAWISALG